MNKEFDEDEAFSLYMEIQNRIALQVSQFQYIPDIPEFTQRLAYAQDGNFFQIKNKYLTRATPDNGVRSCEGYYYNTCHDTYDSPEFSALRNYLSNQGFIEKNTDNLVGSDRVLKHFFLNGHPYMAGGKLASGVIVGMFHARKGL